MNKLFLSLILGTIVTFAAPVQAGVDSAADLTFAEAAAPVNAAACQTAKEKYQVARQKRIAACGKPGYEKGNHSKKCQAARKLSKRAEQKRVHFCGPFQGHGEKDNGAMGAPTPTPTSSAPASSN